MLVRWIEYLEFDKILVVLIRRCKDEVSIFFIFYWNYLNIYIKEE